jgi:Plavaka transposase
MCFDPTHLTKFCSAAEKKHADNADFRNYRRQLFHTSLSHILSSLRPAMSKPEVVTCADGLYRRVVYGLGPYIADYPEQVLISGIVQGWCPRYSPTTAVLESLTPLFR